jgi:DNA-binding NtrC family response regulator
MVISDHLMPNMSGFELLKIVRDRHPDCIRVILTGHADMTIAAEAINHGEIYRFLTKPWDLNELLVTLFIAFDHLELKRENQRLLETIRRQDDAFNDLERQYPGITQGARSPEGAAIVKAA